MAHVFAWLASVVIVLGLFWEPLFFIVLPHCLGGMLDAFFKRGQS